jgi:hypothetical protein
MGNGAGEAKAPFAPHRLFLMLQVRNQFSHRPLIGMVEHGRLSQVSLFLRRFRRQDVAGIGPASLDLSRSRNGKSLRRTPMSLDLWHHITPILRY